VELDPRRGAEEECGMRNSTRGGVRKRNAECETRPEAECGSGMPDLELDPMRSAEEECGAGDELRQEFDAGRGAAMLHGGLARCIVHA
jgi:hypothetical protein